jgi:hypothetical protein
MEEPYGEGLATHSGPESCGCSREGTPEALTGVHAGWVLSLERFTPRAPTASTRTKGNTGRTASARYAPGPAGSETPGTHGSFLHGIREILCLTRNGGKSRSRGGTESPWSPVPRDGKSGEGDPRKPSTSRSALVRAGNHMG